MKKVAIIGCVGVPASYGGFETLVENIIGDNCSVGIKYTIFCSAKEYDDKLESYKGARLVYIPLKANGCQSILYDGLSLLKAIKGYDVVVVLGVSGGLFFPLFRLLSSSRLIVNIDGMEWRRAKWGWLARKVLRYSEILAVRHSDVVIADNQGIVDYVRGQYARECEMIAYGADHVFRYVTSERKSEIMSNYGLTSQSYAITLCRIEPENNCEMIIKAFEKLNLRLIFIGNWCKCDYGKRLKSGYSQHPNITIVDAIYDLDILYVLRSNSRFYIHGHSAGGTNPSLVEAMYCGCNIIAYDVVYNRETTEYKAIYFSDEQELVEILQGDTTLIENSDLMYEVATRRYTWSTIAKEYESLY